MQEYLCLICSLNLSLKFMQKKMNLDVKCTLSMHITQRLVHSSTKIDGTEISGTEKIKL